MEGSEIKAMHFRIHGPSNVQGQSKIPGRALTLSPRQEFKQLPQLFEFAERLRRWQNGVVVRGIRCKLRRPFDGVDLRYALPDRESREPDHEDDSGQSEPRRGP